MNFIRRHSKLLFLFALAFICGVLFFCGKTEENILALIPSNIKTEVELFQASPLSKKLIVITQAQTPQQAALAAGQVREELLKSGYIKPLNLPQEDIISLMLNALPERFSQADRTLAEEKLSAEILSRQFDIYREELFSFESMFAAKKIAADPFNFAQLIFDKWAALGNSTQTEYKDGFISADGGTVLAALYDLKQDVSDLSAAQKVKEFFDTLSKSLPEGARVFFTGGLRYSLENVSVIKKDLVTVSITALLLLCAVFLFFFRRKRAVLIYLLPLLVIMPAAFVTQIIFGGISGITLAFGSVVAGLSVDYAVYVYFALSAVQNRQQALGKISKHLWLTFLTSALCFAALLFSSSAVFKQIGVFALSALALALLAALKVFPQYFGFEGESRKAEIKIKPFAFKAALAVFICLLAFGIWGIKNTKLSKGLDSLNSSSAAFAADKQIAEGLFSADKNALLFALGKTEQEALLNNELLSRNLPEPLAASGIFVSDKTKIENLARWAEFWDEERISAVKELLAQQAAQTGFKPDAFEGFFTWLKGSVTPQNTDFSAFYNPVIKLSGGGFAVVNIVPDSAAYRQAAQKANGVFISAGSLQKQITEQVKKEALTVLCLAALFNFIVLLILFKSFKKTLFCFIPVLCGACLLFGFLALFKAEINLFGLIFLPLLTGLGIDYAVFQLMKYEGKSEASSAIYPPKALMAAGLSTLAGFGVLVLAEHSVLFIMGLCALIGIGGAVFAAVFVLPPFLERYL